MDPTWLLLVCLEGGKSIAQCVGPRAGCVWYSPVLMGPESPVASLLRHGGAGCCLTHPAQASYLVSRLHVGIRSSFWPPKAVLHSQPPGNLGHS